MMRFSSRCLRCGAVINLIPPWMHPVYSCDCGPSGLLFAFSTPTQAMQAKRILSPTINTFVPLNDELTPQRIARMYYYLREVSLNHALTCNLCIAVREQGFVCPDLEALRSQRNKWLALKVAYPEEKNMNGSARDDNKQFTEKLYEYLYYISQELSDKEIAKKLNVSESAMYNRLVRIMDITGCLTRDEVIAYAKEQQNG